MPKQPVRKLVLISIAVVWVQMAVAPIVRIQDVTPDFIFLFFAFFVFFLNREQAIWWAFSIGFLRDLLSNAFFGLETISIVLGTFLLKQVVTQFDKEDNWVQIWATFLYTLSNLLIFILLLSVVQEEKMVGYGHLVKSLLIACYTTVFLPLVFPIFKRIFQVRSSVQQYELF